MRTVRWRIVRLLSELTLLASVIVLLARQWWVFELFTHFRVQLLCAQLVLLAIMLILRRPVWATALAAAAIINAVPIRDYLLPINHDAVADAAPVLRVMTVNVLASNSAADALIDTIRSEAPDVVAVQEFTDAHAAQLTVIHDAYPYRVLAPELGNFGIAVYSRIPLLEHTVLDLEGFAAIHAHVGDDRSDWHLIAAHPVPPVSADMAALRKRQLDAIADVVTALNGARVVVGDFNLTPYSPHFSDFVAATQLRSALRGFGPGFTWPSFMPLLGIAIDHVLVSDDFAVADYRRGPDVGSDHFPVVVDINRREIGLD